MIINIIIGLKIKVFRVVYSRLDSLLSGLDIEIIDIINKVGDES